MGEEAYRRYWTDPQTIEAHTGNHVSAYRNVLAAARPGAAGAVGHQAA
jgi:hypothetical protein